jgi:adenosylmethionine-8-amino-7-oxononanoate aminotransferase
MSRFNPRQTASSPEDEPPDRRALELAAMCDLVVTGAARVASATFPRSDDEPDIVTLAKQITAGRRLVADVELAAHSVTIYIRAPQAERRSSGG